MTTLAPVKATQTDLTAFADTVQEALDGLKRLKQVDLESVLTSLCSECLPEKVRLAWEDSTEACRTVAPVTELLEFVRRKADNPLYMDRSRGSSHQEKGGYQEKRLQEGQGDLLMWLCLHHLQPLLLSSLLDSSILEVATRAHPTRTEVPLSKEADILAHSARINTTVMLAPTLDG